MPMEGVRNSRVFKPLSSGAASPRRKHLTVKSFNAARQVSRKKAVVQARSAVKLAEDDTSSRSLLSKHAALWRACRKMERAETLPDTFVEMRRMKKDKDLKQRAAPARTAEELLHAQQRRRSTVGRMAVPLTPAQERRIQQENATRLANWALQPFLRADCANERPEEGFVVSGGLGNDSAMAGNAWKSTASHYGCTNDVGRQRPPPAPAPPAKPGTPEALAKLNKIRALMCAASYTMGGQDWEGLLARADTDGTGALDEEELTRLIRRTLKMPVEHLSDPDISALFVSIDQDGSGELDYAEIVAFLDNDDEVEPMMRSPAKQKQAAVAAWEEGAGTDEPPPAHRTSAGKIAARRPTGRWVGDASAADDDDDDGGGGGGSDDAAAAEPGHSEVLLAVDRAEADSQAEAEVPAHRTSAGKIAARRATGRWVGDGGAAASDDDDDESSSSSASEDQFPTPTKSEADADAAASDPLAAEQVRASISEMPVALLAPAEPTMEQLLVAHHDGPEDREMSWTTAEETGGRAASPAPMVITPGKGMLGLFGGHADDCPEQEPAEPPASPARAGALKQPNSPSAPGRNVHFAHNTKPGSPGAGWEHRNADPRPPTPGKPPRAGAPAASAAAAAAPSPAPKVHRRRSTCLVRPTVYTSDRMTRVRARIKQAAYEVYGRDWMDGFMRFDTDGSGELSLSEFEKALRHHLRLPSSELSSQSVKKIFRLLDADGSGEVSTFELVEFFKDRADETSVTPNAKQRKRRMTLLTGNAAQAVAPGYRTSADAAGHDPKAAGRLRGFAGRASPRPPPPGGGPTRVDGRPFDARLAESVAAWTAAHDPTPPIDRAEYPFSPDINPLSREMVREKYGESGTVGYLVRLDRSIERFNDRDPPAPDRAAYSPAINDLSRQIVRDRYGEDAYDERMEASLKRHQEMLIDGARRGDLGPGADLRVDHSYSGVLATPSPRALMARGAVGADGVVAGVRSGPGGTMMGSIPGEAARDGR